MHWQWLDAVFKPQLTSIIMGEITENIEETPPAYQEFVDAFLVQEKKTIK